MNSTIFLLTPVQLRDTISQRFHCADHTSYMSTSASFFFLDFVFDLIGVIALPNKLRTLVYHARTSMRQRR